jgi:hypothetical protein
VAAATRGGRFGEYNYRCACIAQLVEQLTLNKLFFVADRIGKGTAWVDALSRGSGGGATGTIRPSTSSRMPTSGFEFAGPSSASARYGSPAFISKLTAVVNSSQWFASVRP